VACQGPAPFWGGRALAGSKQSPLDARGSWAAIVQAPFRNTAASIDRPATAYLNCKLRNVSRPMTFEPFIRTAADKPPSAPGWVHEDQA
jgi:hypothetical protein